MITRQVLARQINRISCYYCNKRMIIARPVSTSALSLLTLLTATSTFSITKAFSVKPNQLKNSSTASASSSTMPSLANIQFDNSWITQLTRETTENLEKSKSYEGIDADDNTNKQRRPIYNGHYVIVKPTGLTDPQLVLLSNDVAKNELGLTESQVESDDFLQYVSGNASPTASWATPYALSIMGTRYTNNCPYGTGNGYGDGRAISVGEFHGNELQLKGAGKTPFCRGADGKAVLRSSIREFLASEAMHYFGIGTTRALSLVVSNKDTATRPWYSPNTKLQLPSMDDPRLAQYSIEERRKILAQLRNEKSDPNIMIQEQCAITCRVARSFVRVGHLDLYARRLQKLQQQSGGDGVTSNEYKELVEMVWHACYREFREDAYEPFYEKGDLDSAARVLLEQSAEKLGTMVAGWLRVGFAQGNFNADNCLIAGRTMDYGPFGFMEEYSPEFAKWTGSGKHFGFLNQPQAALVNYQVLVESIVPVMKGGGPDDDKKSELIDEFLNKAMEVFQTKVRLVFQSKLGFTEEENDVADDLWHELRPMLHLNRVDWTLFWRQLSIVAKEYTDYDDDNYEAMMTILEGEGESSPFYEPLSDKERESFVSWMEKWRSALKGTEGIAERMRLANPKYVLREWMLVEAYTMAAKGDYEELNKLYDLIRRPYEEGTSEEELEYYRRTPDHYHLAGGAAFMT
mmetsp:Transcript_8692/g.13575  ORF Transcript_8692/g.13575 Transcript_8692/m.13575 type:complete len:688 (+) Transcript_8692:108-2171(+)